MIAQQPASPLFRLTVLVTIGLAGVIGLMVLMMQIQPGFMGMSHFTARHHRVHDVTFGLLIGTAVVGMFVQLRTPSKNVAGQVMALIPWAALGLTSALTSTPIRFAPFPLFAALTLLAAILHPRRREMIRVFNASRVNWTMIGLVAIAAIPLLSVAFSNINFQSSLTNDHAKLGHYGFMAAYGVTVIAVGFLASLRPDGWRLTAWAAGLLPVFVGIASLIYPGVDSSLSSAWAIAAVAWGVVFVAAAHLAYARDSNQGAVGETDVRCVADRTNTAPRWVYPTALIAVVLVALFVIILHVTGGSFRHGSQ